MAHNRIFLTLAAALAALHLAWLSSWVVIGYASPDADGYFAQASMMAAEGVTTFEPESPVQHIGMHWIEKPGGSFISRYPAGFPAILAAVWTTLGREAMFYVNPLLTSLSVLFVFLLCRPWTGDGPALAAAVVQAGSLIANSHAINSDSHASTAFFLLAGIVALDRWFRDGRVWWAVAAGLALGLVPAVRYAEVVAGLGVALFLYFAWKRPERRGQIAWIAAAAALPVGWTMWRNQVHFGALWRTAYSLTGESTLSLQYFLENWASYVDGLVTSGAGLFIPFAFLGMAVMIRREETRPLGSLLAATTVSVTLVYCCYYFNQGRPDRFLMPIVPLFLLPAIVFLQRSLSAKAFPVALAVLAALQTFRAADGTTARMERQRSSAERSATVLAWLEENVPEGSIIVGSRSLNEQIHFDRRWKLADASLFSSVGRRGVRGGPGDFGGGSPGGFGGPGGPERRFRGGDDSRPSPMQPGKAASLRARYVDLGPRERSRLAAEDIRAWAGESQVFWVGSEDESEAVSREIGTNELLGRIEMPGGSEEEPAALRHFSAGGPGRPGGRRGGPGGPGGGLFGLGSETLVVYRLAP